MARHGALLSGLVLLTATVALPSAAASHSDGSYDIPVWFTWGQTELDMWILPPMFGQIFNGNGALNNLDPREVTPLNSHLRAVLDVTQDWRNAIAQFGAPYMAGVKVNTYVVGIDAIPPNTDPEIIVVLDPVWKLFILGLAVSSGFPCIVDVGQVFLVVSYTYADVYNVAGQEIGHCLGANHVVDGHPTLDIMNGGYPHTIGEASTPLHCISNLDVKGLERVFGGNFGQPSGGTASLPVSQYQTTNCAPSPVPPILPPLI